MARTLVTAVSSSTTKIRGTCVLFEEIVVSLESVTVVPQDNYVDVDRQKIIFLVSASETMKNVR